MKQIRQSFEVNVKKVEFSAVKRVTNFIAAFFLKVEVFYLKKDSFSKKNKNLVYDVLYLTNKPLFDAKITSAVAR